MHKEKSQSYFTMQQLLNHTSKMRESASEIVKSIIGILNYLHIRVKKNQRSRRFHQFYHKYYVCINLASWKELMRKSPPCAIGAVKCKWILNMCSDVGIFCSKKGQLNSPEIAFLRTQRKGLYPFQFHIFSHLFYEQWSN